MKSYILLFLLVSTLGIGQTFASGWLVSPSGKLTNEDKKVLNELQKYQEPLNKKKSSVVPKVTTPTSPTDNLALQKQLDTLFAALQAKIASKSISAQNSVYSTLISRIKNIQAKSSNLSAKNTFILSYLLKKAESAKETVKNPTGTGTTTPTSTGSLAKQSTIGNLTLLPENLTSQTGSSITLWKFKLSGDITLNDLYLTITSDAAIKMSESVDILKIRNNNGQIIGDADSYELIGTNTLKVYFDAAYFLRAWDYSIISSFEDKGNTVFNTYVDVLNSSRGNISYKNKEYLLGTTTLKK